MTADSTGFDPDKVNVRPQRRFQGDEETAWSVLRFKLLERRPYYAAGALRLRPIVVEGTGTMTIDDHWRLYIDPIIFIGADYTALAVQLEHHLSHLLREHPRRAREMGVMPWEKKAWNVCACCEINDDFARSDLRETDPHPTMFGWETGDVAESYFQRLREEADQAGGQPGDGQGGEPGDDQDGDGDGGAGQGDDEGAGQDGGQGDEDGQGPWTDGCGTGAGGVKPWFELPAGPDPLDPRPISDTEAKIARDTVAQAALDHSLKGRGDVPAGLLRWANGRLEPPQVSWQRLLAAKTRSAIGAWRRGRTDRTFSRLGRREAAGDFVLPGTYTPSPKLALVVDTSGSMSEADLRAAMAEVGGIAKQIGINGRDLMLYSVDAAVATQLPVWDPSKIVLKGGGGTDIRVGIATALANGGKHLSAIVVLTDCDTPWPESRAELGKTALIIGAVGTKAHLDAIRGGAGYSPVPTWASTVYIETDRKAA